MMKTVATKTPGSYGVALDKHEKNAWVEDPVLSGAQLEHYKYPGPDQQPKQSSPYLAAVMRASRSVRLSPQGRPY